jgi:hypothetical protein
MNIPLLLIFGFLGTVDDVNGVRCWCSCEVALEESAIRIVSIVKILFTFLLFIQPKKDRTATSRVM